MADIVVSRSFNQAVTETVQKRVFVGENDILLNPNLTPLFAMSTRLNGRKPVNSVRVEWVEDDFIPHWGQVSNGTTDYASNATNIAVVDSTLFAVNDLVAVPKAASSSAAEEVVLVTAIASPTLTITRGIGGSGADTIGATGDLRIIGSAYTEGSSFGTVRSTSKSVQISYAQIFREPVKVTKTMAAQAQFGAENERMFQRRKALEQYNKQIESALLYSRASESLASPTSRWTTMGFKSRVSTNVYNANTTLTSSGMMSFAELAFGKYYEGNEKVLLAAPRVVSAFDQVANNVLRLAPTDDVFGVKVKRYVTDHGDFLIVRDLLLENSPNSGLGWGDEAFAVDLKSCELHPLSGNGENRDTSLLTDVIKDGTDVYADEYLGQIASVIRFEKRHARLYNCSATS